MTSTSNGRHDPDDADLDVSHDFQITQVEPRTLAAGSWVRGTLAGHRFEALVFADHADCPGWELGESCISKLWIQRIADGQVVFHFDRGMDLPATDRVAQRIAGFLEAGLADHIYGA